MTKNPQRNVPSDLYKSRREKWAEKAQGDTVDNKYTILTQ